MSSPLQLAPLSSKKRQKSLHFMQCIIFNLILYLFKEDCQQPEATRGSPQHRYIQIHNYQSFEYKHVKHKTRQYVQDKTYTYNLTTHPSNHSLILTRIHTT